MGEVRDISPHQKSRNICLFIVAVLEWSASGGKSRTHSSFDPLWIHIVMYKKTPYDGVIEAPDPIRIVHIIYLKVALELVV